MPQPSESRTPPQSRARRQLPTALGLAVLVLGFMGMKAAATLSETDGSDFVRPDTAPFIDVIMAKETGQDYVIAAPGRLRSRQATALVGEIAGTVVFMNPNFVLGGRMGEGDILFRIDPSDYQIAVDNAKANLAAQKASLLRAELAYKRRSDLVKKEVVSEAANDDAIADLAAAKARVDQAKAQLDQAAKNLERTEVRTPFPALVVEETVSLGTYVAPGQVLGTIIDTSEAELVVGLQPKEATALARYVANNPAPIGVIAKPNSGSVSTKSLAGVLDRFAPQVDRAARTALVVGLFKDAFAPENAGQIFADDFMTLEITIRASEQVYSLPAGTVRRGGYVWVIEDEKLVRADVTVLRRQAGRSLVTSARPLGDLAILGTLLSEERQGLRVRLANKSR